MKGAFVGIGVGFAFIAYLSYGDTAVRAGVVLEDSPSWSCNEMGNRVCGPNNSEHKVAGCYDQWGELVRPWPCDEIEVN